MKGARRAVLIVTGALGALGLVLVMLLSANSQAGFTGCAIAELGWAAPLLALSVLGGATWFLLGQRRTDQGDRTSYEAVPCSACGREVLGQWRMCPYCGAMLDQSPHRHAVPESVGE